MNLTQCEAGKRGPALMKRLVGDGSMHKELLDRKPLTAEDGVKCYMDTFVGAICVSTSQPIIMGSGKECGVDREPNGGCEWLGAGS